MVLVVIIVLVFVVWRAKKHVKKAIPQKQTVKAPVKRNKSIKVADVPFFLLDELPFPKAKKAVSRTVKKGSRQVAQSRNKVQVRSKKR